MDNKLRYDHICVSCRFHSIQKKIEKQGKEYWKCLNCGLTTEIKEVKKDA